MTQSFYPPRRILMGPGPSDVSARVAGAVGRPTIGHLDPEFLRMMDELKSMLQFAFRTNNALTLPVSAPGSAGMETAFVNLVEPGEKVVVCRNGVFGGRMVENVQRIGAQAIIVDDEWGSPVDLDKVRSALAANPDTCMLAFVHAETSTGVRSDVAELCGLAREADALSLVDCVTSLGGIDVDVDGWGADAVYSGTQKCLSAPPGISPVTFSERAAQLISSRNKPVQSWFLDLGLVLNYWSGAKRVYHHTAPINLLYALHESLVMLEEEGLSAAWARHDLHHQAFVAGVEAMGLSMLVAPEYRLPQLNAVNIPAGVDDAVVRQRLLNEFGIEIGAGLGTLAGKVWRVGIMGYGARKENVVACLSALGVVLRAQGINVDIDAALAAVANRYQAAGP